MNVGAGWRGGAGGAYFALCQGQRTEKRLVRFKFGQDASTQWARRLAVSKLRTCWSRGRQRRTALLAHRAALCTRGAGLFSVNYSPSFVESQREFASKLSTCTRSCRGPRTRSDARTRTHTIPVRTAKFGSVCVPGYVWKARVARALGLSGFHSGSERQPSRRHYCPGLPWAPGLHIGLCVGRVPSNSLRTLRFGAGAAPRGVIPSQPTQPTQVHRPRRAGF